MSETTYCPDCGRKGVRFRFAQVVPGEDGYGCRYCDFWFFTGSGRYAMDRDNEARWEDYQRHFVYGSGGSTVHLIRFEDAAKWPNPAAICGRRAPHRMPLEQGDETLSGVAATCKRCRQIAQIDRSEVSR